MKYIIPLLLILHCACSVFSELLIAKPLYHPDGYVSSTVNMPTHPQNGQYRSNNNNNNNNGNSNSNNGNYNRNNNNNDNGNSNRHNNNYPVNPATSASTTSSKSAMPFPLNLLISKPLFNPYQNQQSAQSSNQIDVIEQGGIEIPEMGGIEYYELMKHIRSLGSSVKDVAVKTPGTVAGAIQTAWRGSTNILSQVAHNMPEISMPEISIPIPSFTSSASEDSYTLAAPPLAPFPYFRTSFFGKKNRPPVESYWLDTYGV